MKTLEAEAGLAGAEGFFATPEFWVLVAFVILVGFASRPLFRKIAGALDDRSAAIRRQLDEARELREEAQELLASYQRKHRDSAAEAEAVLDLARDVAASMTERAMGELERTLKRSEQLALNRIAHAESKAIDHVRDEVADVALDAVARVIAKTVTGEKADALIETEIEELPKKLN